MWIELSLGELLEVAPMYNKVMKEVLKGNKGRRRNIKLTASFNAIMQQKIPVKKTDPGRFIIPCEISGRRIEKWLCYLGSSVNLMPK